MNLVDEIIAFEDGTLTHEQELELFSTLIKTGKVYQLQGMYGRYARDLIQSGYLSPRGDILV